MFKKLKQPKIGLTGKKHLENLPNKFRNGRPILNNMRHNSEI